ncbi:snaclec 3-like isoform X2 [Dreissena polymorpha]|uniref:snaclec 3-like isoform X2 n=1 Tax=Dreissena polymorpha TaxID=45954 RepID=UPI0022640F51|nr:snaclec 3-like isoform X2 [Dreissena polymorpha]
MYVTLFSNMQYVFVRLLILQWSLITCYVASQTADDVKNLTTTLYKSAEYSKKVRPLKDQNEAVVVGTDLILDAGDCPSGWLSRQDSCYKWNSSNWMTFDQAKDYWSSLGAHVLYIDKEEENDVAAFVLNATTVPGAWVWIGVNFTDERWISSINNRFVTYFNWRVGEPDRLDDQFCVSIHEGYQWRWSNVRCTEISHAICEIDM